MTSSVSDLKSLGLEGRVSVTVERGAGKASVDPLKFKRLIDILLDNAIKFSEDSTPVEIDVKKSGGVTTVAVMDRGIGVPAEARDKVFNRFYQVEDVRHHSSVGLGLGLYLAREIVAAHDGTIEVDERPGGGSIMRFTIGPS